MDLETEALQTAHESILVYLLNHAALQHSDPQGFLNSALEQLLGYVSDRVEQESKPAKLDWAANSHIQRLFDVSKQSLEAGGLPRKNR